MAIYIMDSKTLLKDFVNQNPKMVLKTQYVIVSQSIKRRGRYKNIIIGNHLYPDMSILTEYMDTEDKEIFEEDYMEELKQYDAFFATLIKGAIEERFTIVFLCSKTEAKDFGYLDILSKYVWKRFKFPVYDYKALSKGKSGSVKYNKESVIRTCNSALKKAKEKQLKDKMRSVAGRREILSDMSKKDMIKELKERDLYYKGMTKKDMKDALEVFFVNE